MSRIPDGALTLEPPSTQPELIYVVLTPGQAALLNPLIDRHRKAFGVTGLLCAITRSCQAQAGATVLQLQVLPLNRKIASLLSRAVKANAQPPHNRPRIK
jgi:hypothetical protein